MSSIPSAINLNGLSQRTYQKTEIFDTPGNHTWIHPLPGQNIEVFVTLVGGGGGGGGGAQDTQGDATSGTDGGDTIWDTAGSVVTATGGGSGSYGNDTSNLNGIGGRSDFKPGDAFNETTGNSLSWYLETNVIPGVPYGYGGKGGYGPNYAGGTAGTGDYKTFNSVVSTDINLTVGAGGIGGGGTGTGMSGSNGGVGACIVSYNITTTQTPVVVNMQRRDWEHFGEISWRTAPNTASQLITGNTRTKLNLDTEVLDTGNKVVVNGDNTFTLQAGTYEIETDVLIYESTAGQVEAVLSLLNETDSTFNSTTVNEYASRCNNTILKCVVSIPSPKTFSLELLTSTNSGVGQEVTVNLTDSTPNSSDRTRVLFKWRP
jgi:CheY-specific phosphatase CheX